MMNLIFHFGYGWMRRYRGKVGALFPHNSNEILLLEQLAVGPHDNFDLETCHVIPALIKEVKKAKIPLLFVVLMLKETLYLSKMLLMVCY